jgi:hypothetical protein
MGYLEGKTADLMPIPGFRRPSRAIRRGSWARQRVCHLFPFLTLLVGSAIAAGSRPTIFADPLPTRYRTQSRFTAALDRPISGSWKGVALRAILRRLSRERDVAILLDRRVDPEQLIDIDTGERSLASAVDDIARLAHLAVSRIGNCLIVSPPSAASRLRTLVALRERELAESDVDASERLSRLRTMHATIRWDDLDRPVDIVRTIGRQFGLSVAGIEQIPHDLWAGAVCPETTAAEALSLVLNQFDLTFEWTDHGSGVRLVAVPPAVAIERQYALHGKPTGEALRMLHSKIEGIDADVRDGKLVVRGSVEQHEIVATILGIAKGSAHTAGKRPSTSLERQSFTLQAHGVSLRDLFDELRKQGLTIQYDAEQLRKAGIDLTQKVSIDLPQLPAPQFFKRLLEPFSLTFHFTHTAIVLEPK